MKIKKKWLVFGLILLFLLGAGIGILLKNPAAQQTAESAAVPVQSVAAVTGCLDKVFRHGAPHGNGRDPAG